MVFSGWNILIHQIVGHDNLKVTISVDFSDEVANSCGYTPALALKSLINALLNASSSQI